MLKIKELRIKNNLSQTDLAKKLCVSNKTISAYESGLASPKIETLIKLSKIFNCSIDYILDNTLPFEENNNYSDFNSIYNDLSITNKQLLEKIALVLRDNQKN